MADWLTETLVARAGDARATALKLGGMSPQMATVHMLDANLWASLAVVASLPHLDMGVVDELERIVKSTDEGGS